MRISDYSKALLISSSRIIPHVDTAMGVIILIKSGREKMSVVLIVGKILQLTNNKINAYISKNNFGKNSDFQQGQKRWPSFIKSCFQNFKLL